MKHTTDEFKNTLGQVQHFLNQGIVLPFSQDEKSSLLEDSRRLVKKLDAITDSVLTVGLLGGTGVGKSSIMNALAGSHISSASHRRPHTDQIQVYHHVRVELPPLLRTATVPWKAITHEADNIRQIVLCDLPDFDSLLGDHCEHTVHFLEHLDLLVWVSSPEKYADASFYSFLDKVPKAKDNFYFVLNKVDLFFDGSMEDGYDKLARVTGRFQQHLAERGISDPYIYALSVIEDPGSQASAPWNQLAGFRHQVFQLRDGKEVLAIKGANLDVEMERLISFIETGAAGYEKMCRFAHEFAEELAGHRNEWKAKGRDALERWILEKVDGHSFAESADISPLVGPGYGIGTLVNEWGKWSQGKRREAGVEASHNIGAPTVLKYELERIEDRAAHHILRSGLPAAFVNQIKEILDISEEWAGFAERLHRYADSRAACIRNESFGWFKARQYTVYSIMFVLLLLALGGESAWSDVLKNPGWYYTGRLVTAMVAHVYSPVGLAALGSYILLLTIFGFRFYAGFRKSLLRRTRRMAEALKVELTEMWMEQLETIINRFEGLERTLKEEMSNLAAIDNHIKKD